MKKIFIVALAMLFTFGFVTISQAFECPKVLQMAEKELQKAEEAAAEAAEGIKEQVNKDIAAAKELLQKGQDLHNNAQALSDHATAVKTLYESIGASKEAFYLATKVK